jgi:hypothetical protein
MALSSKWRELKACYHHFWTGHIYEWMDPYFTLLEIFDKNLNFLQSMETQIGNFTHFNLILSLHKVNFLQKQTFADKMLHIFLAKHENSNWWFYTFLFNPRLTQNKYLFQKNFADLAAIAVLVCAILLLFCFKNKTFLINLH